MRAEMLLWLCWWPALALPVVLMPAPAHAAATARHSCSATAATSAGVDARSTAAASAGRMCGAAKQIVARDAPGSSGEGERIRHRSVWAAVAAVAGTSSAAIDSGLQQQLAASVHCRVYAVASCPWSHAGQSGIQLRCVGIQVPSYGKPHLVLSCPACLCLLHTAGLVWMYR